MIFTHELLQPARAINTFKREAMEKLIAVANAWADHTMAVMKCGVDEKGCVTVRLIDDPVMTTTLGQDGRFLLEFHPPTVLQISPAKQSASEASDTTTNQKGRTE